MLKKLVGLTIELDGNVHLNNELEDGIRQHRIEELGVRFLRFTNDDVFFKIGSVVEEIRKVIEDYS